MTQSHPHQSMPSVAIIGLGLMGGSLAALISEKHPDIHVYGVARKKDTLDFAYNKGWIQDGVQSISNLPKTVGLVIVCTPIDVIDVHIRDCLLHVSDTTIITDIASTKAWLANHPHLAGDPRFVPGHPMGGTEHTGIAHAAPSILANIPYIFVSRSFKDNALQTKFNENLASLNAWFSTLSVNTMTMDASQHDAIVGYVSHLPYLLSTTLSALYSDYSKNDQAHIIHTAGPGFKDTSRVSGSSPDWGADVCLTNKQALLTLISQAKQRLTQLETMIQSENKDNLTRFFDKARANRRHIIP